MMPAFPGPLWSRRDRVGLVVALIGGAVLIGWSWFLAAGRDDAGTQLAQVTLAMAGAGLGFAAALVWLGRGRRAVLDLSWLLLGTVDGVTPETTAASDLVAGPTARYFHRADCLLVSERAFPAASRAQHEGARRQPCPACRP
jgi:membrane protease YdiL (CAAX protease family)